MADRPYKTRSTRSVVRSNNGMIATSQPLASAAGLGVLMEGGSAADAAIAAASVLGVVEPLMTGVGGDAFALVWDSSKKELIGLNGSGRSARAASITDLRRDGLTEMPLTGALPVTVPGTVDAWCTLLERYGRLGLKRILQPAIDYAVDGFPVSEIIADQWRLCGQVLDDCDEARKTYFVDGRPPRTGEIFRNPNLGSTYQKIAEGGKEAFYEGEIAQAICSYLQEKGSTLDLPDFKAHRSEWVQPISTCYRGYEVFELPPNGQGVAALEMLNILEGYDLNAMGPNSADYLHLLVEAKKMAFADRDRYIGDPHFSSIPVETLVSKGYAKSQRLRIDMNKAQDFGAGNVHSSDTVYLTVVDSDRNCVSFINSIFHGFGSGLVAPATGIILQNRGSLFSLDPGHPNALEPGKRPLHTIIPAMVLKDGSPWLCFGVIGGDMQPQGHVQVLVNMIDHGMDVQEAGEAPRVRHSLDSVAVESEIPLLTLQILREKGHQLSFDFDVFGGYQGILIDPDTGALAGGSDPRTDGAAMGY